MLKEELPNIAIFAVEPKDSAVLSGKSGGVHGIQGIGAGFIPKILNTKVYGEVIEVTTKDAIKTAKMLAKEEGLLVGISTGANVWATMEVASRDEFKGKTLVTILCDTGERYMSTALFEDE